MKAQRPRSIHINELSAWYCIQRIQNMRPGLMNHSNEDEANTHEFNKRAMWLEAVIDPILHLSFHIRFILFYEFSTFENFSCNKYLVQRVAIFQLLTYNMSRLVNNKGKLSEKFFRCQVSNKILERFFKIQCNDNRLSISIYFIAYYLLFFQFFHGFTRASPRISSHLLPCRAMKIYFNIATSGIRLIHRC